jgi:hypothetical protein
MTLKAVAADQHTAIMKQLEKIIKTLLVLVRHTKLPWVNSTRLTSPVEKLTEFVVCLSCSLMVQFCLYFEFHALYSSSRAEIRIVLFGYRSLTRENSFYSIFS